MDKKESSLMGLVGSLCLLRGEKKLLLEKENLGSLLKSKSTWSPASVLNLKMWIRFLNFWNLTFQNEKMDGKWTDSPLRNTTPLKSKNFDLPQKYKKPKFQLPLPPFPPNFSGGVHAMTSLPRITGKDNWRIKCMLVCTSLRWSQRTKLLRSL